jgi:hypothetical protein
MLEHAGASAEGLDPWLSRPGPMRIRPRRAIDTDLVFVAQQVTVDMVKDIVLLRRVEPALRCTALVWGAGFQKALAERHLDVVTWRTVAELASLVRATRARALVAATRADAPLARVARTFWDGRFVYRPYPFAHRDSDGGSDPRLDAEREVLRQSDAVYHYFDPSAVEELRARVGFTAPAFELPPSCVREFFPRVERTRLSLRDGEPHVAYIAGFPLRTDEVVGYLESLPEKLETLLAARIHVHVYSRGWSAAEIHPAFDRVARDPRFHVEPVAQYDDLVEQLTAYDWGFYHFDLSRIPIRGGFERFASNGFFSFLEAGLPVVTSPETPTYAELVERYAAGLVVDPAEWARIPDALRSADAEAMRAGARAARTELEPDERLLHRTIFDT